MTSNKLYDCLDERILLLDGGFGTMVQGYGLGLAIVKVVMEAHGMDYGVENIEGGVRIWFCLPLAEIGEEAAPEEDGDGGC